MAVTDPGFDIRGGGREVCQRGGGALKVLTVKVCHFAACFCHISITFF